MDTMQPRFDEAWAGVRAYTSQGCLTFRFYDHRIVITLRTSRGTAIARAWELRRPISASHELYIASLISVLLYSRPCKPHVVDRSMCSGVKLPSTREVFSNLSLVFLSLAGYTTASRRSSCSPERWTRWIPISSCRVTSVTEC